MIRRMLGIILLAVATEYGEGHYTDAEYAKEYDD